MKHEQVLKVPADTRRLHEVLDFVNIVLEEHDCSPRTETLIDICLEEMFVNIAHYAYPGNDGWAEIHISVSDGAAVITLIDGGIPYNPLEKPDPDVTLALEDRAIGGLGIYMVKKKMDTVTYAYEAGHNILTMSKIL